MNKKYSNADELTTALFSMLRLARQQFQDKTRKISILQLHTLHFIADNPKITMKDLSKHFKITPPSATSLVDSLVKTGKIKKNVDKNDLRKTLLIITPTGAKIIEKENAKIAQNIKKLFSHLNDQELNDFIQIIKKIIQTYEK